jgi:hypothetical protein
VSRNAPTVLALLLLVGTATAFVVTQQLKLEPSPISQTHVDKVFSPVCECESQTAEIDFTLRRADHLRIGIRIDGREVPIANGEFGRGVVRARWNGRDASGAVVPDGIYFPLVHMRRTGRTIDLPNPIRVDTQPPTIAATSLRSNRSRLTVSYNTSEPARAVLLLDGRRAVYTSFKRRRSHFTWYGRVNGRPVRARHHRLILLAEDLAGNRSPPIPLR